MLYFFVFSLCVVFLIAMVINRFWMPFRHFRSFENRKSEKSFSANLFLDCTKVTHLYIFGTNLNSVCTKIGWRNVKTDMIL